jgi:hypothetical protein
VLNPQALDSTACTREYGYAAAIGKPVLPVLVAEGVSTSLLPPALSQIQFVDYRQQDRNAALRLARALASVPPPQALPDPLPPPPEVPVSYLGSLAAQVDGSTALSYEQQSALVVDLKKGLRDPATAGDVRTLLQRLRKRRDLFAAIADEIEELLGPAGRTAASDATNGTPSRTETREPGGSRPATDAVAVEPAALMPSGISMLGRLRLSLVWAIVGGVLGVTTMLMSGEADAWFVGLLPALGLGIARAILGPHRGLLKLALGGVVLGVLGIAMIVTHFAGAIVVGTPIGAILGAIVGLILRKKNILA